VRTKRRISTWRTRAQPGRCISRSTTRALHLHLHPMSISSDGGSPVWPLFQTVLGVSTPRRPQLRFSPCSFPSPSSKSRLSAFLATSSRDEASLTNQHRGFVTFILHLILLTDSVLFTAIERHKRQLLHSLSTLFQSRVLPFPRSATIILDSANGSLSFQRNCENYGSSPSSSCSLPAFR